MWKGWWLPSGYSVPVSYTHLFAVYSDADVEAFAKEYFRSTKQDKNAVGRMSSGLKPVADRYNQKTQAERYQFRRLLRSLVKWYGYVSRCV